MIDVERVRGFGKTLKAFQSVADQLNEIADLQSLEKEAKRLTQKARSDFHKAMDNLLGANDKLKEANSLTEQAYKETDTVNKSSKASANHILNEASRKAEDMVQNAHEAADKIRHVSEVQISKLKKDQYDLVDENKKLALSLEELHSEMALLKARLG